MEEASMASRYAPRSYNDAMLNALEQALRDVFEVLKAHDPHHYSDKDRALKMAIANTLMALADTGVTDPQELRSRTLECFELKAPH
jgi:hypothetical protein